MDAHRVRRLRWRARATGPAEAFALRSLLHEQGDACAAALDRAFGSAAPAGEVWRLPRLALTIRVPGLHHLEAEGLSERVEAALRVALAEAAQARPGAAERLGAAAHGPSPDARPEADASAQAMPSRRPAATEERLALLHYLSTGLLPWTLAGLALELAQRSLRDAAVLTTESVLSGSEALDLLLPRAGTDARIGPLLRWLPLLPAPLRRRWLAASRAPLALDAVAVEAWRAWVDDDGADRIEWQALWLAGPLDAAALSARIDSQRSAPSAAPPFLPALIKVLASTATASSAGHRAAAATENGATDTAASALLPPFPQAIAASSAAPESLLVPLAGLVLLHPWLPRLLAGCGVLDDAGRQIAQMPRACALLHALACGDAEPAEHQLPFVKLLLGRPPDEPLTAALPVLAPADHEEIAALLAAVREHWTALRGTAVEGLRLSFLQRRGLLERADAAWQLRMQGEAFDLLLGLLPWSIGLVRLPWMRDPLVVEWATP